MKKSNKFWYLILLVFLISFFISGCSSKSGVEKKKWFQYASKFDQARSQTIANELAGKKSAFQDIAEMDYLKWEFLRAKQPSETQIISVLKSSDRNVQRVGLAAMCLKPVQTEQVIDILFEFLKDQDRDFKFYAVNALNQFIRFPQPKKETLGKQLLEIIKNENDKGQVASEIILLGKFPSEEAAQFLTEQLIKEGEENEILRFVAFKALKEMRGSFYDKVAEYVNQHGSPQIKEEFLNRENSWEKINVPTEK